MQAALQGETYAYLTMINAPADCIVAGEADACRRVVAKIGRSRCVQNEGEIIAHHPVMRSWESEWRVIHSRATQPVPGVRFYSNARGGAYTPDRDSVAAALTDQATAGVDFRRVVEAAYADGVRIFVEHGPRNVCSGWIRSILGDRPHLAVALDRPQNGVEQLLEAAAELVAAGVPLDYVALNRTLAAAEIDTATAGGSAFAHLVLPRALPTGCFAAAAGSRGQADGDRHPAATHGVGASSALGAEGCPPGGGCSARRQEPQRSARKNRSTSRRRYFC